MSQTSQGTATNIITGEKFHYNGIAEVNGINVPHWSSIRTSRFLNPAKTDRQTLLKLNPNMTFQEDEIRKKQFLEGRS